MAHNHSWSHPCCCIKPRQLICTHAPQVCEFDGSQAWHTSIATASRSTQPMDCEGWDASPKAVHLITNNEIKSRTLNNQPNDTYKCVKSCLAPIRDPVESNPPSALVKAHLREISRHWEAEHRRWQYELVRRSYLPSFNARGVEPAGTVARKPFHSSKKEQSP